MSEPLANDFGGIAARMRELKCEAVSDELLGWWCPDCQKEVDGRDVTYQEMHDERAGGCGCKVYPACSECDNGGWIMASYQPAPPNFDICPKCFNPSENPSP